MSENQVETQSEQVAEEISLQAENKKTPSKRSRRSFIERAQKESEELVKNMGGSLELEGGRRTRSSARGTPTRAAIVTPPPAKKARNSPASPKTTPKGRGRGRKLDTSMTPEPPEQVPNKEEKEAVEEKKATVETSNDVIEEKVTDVVKTTVESETNGPEKTDNEKDNDVQAVVQEQIEPAEALVNSLVKNIDNEKQNAASENDQVDAGLEPVSEEVTNNIDNQSKADTLKENPLTKKAPSPKPDVEALGVVDSPMDVDEQSEVEETKTATPVEPSVTKSVECAAESAAVVKESEAPSNVSVEAPIEEKAVGAVIVAKQPTPEPVSVVKQPTPEPMEIDSSSKSSDVIECTDVVDKPGAPENNIQLNAMNSFQPQTDPKPLVAASTEEPVVAEAQLEPKGEEKSLENDIPTKLPEAENLKSIDNPVSIEQPKLDMGENKAENNLDEPKIASPQLNTTGDATLSATL